MFAADDIGGMGHDGKLPWPHNKTDMNWFKAHTIGDVVVMGSKTWNSGMPKPLRGRINWVVSGSAKTDEDIQTYRSKGADGVWNQDPILLLKNLEQQYRDKTIWVIGGAQLLSSMQGIFDRVYYTKIYGMYEADVSIDVDHMLREYSKILTEKHDTLEFNIYAKLS